MAILTSKCFLLYKTIKILARIAIHIFCRKIIITNPGVLKIKGPVLLAANHPNSFLDSVIIDTLFDEPVWSLARGDVFKKPFYIRVLSSLKILPVYRTSEGVENLSENYKTFEACIEIFRKNGIITIFSEGKCVNEWHLRPLKKGTARLALKAWEEGIPLKVVPVGINYSSFKRFGKNIYLNFGEAINPGKINMTDPDGVKHIAFNNVLETQLKQLVFEIPLKDREAQKERLETKPSTFTKIILGPPALAGWLFHLPLYLPVKMFVWKRTHDNDHYDSVMTGTLLVLYPVYLIILIIAAWLISSSWWSLSILILLPFTAWSYVQLKAQIDK